jgi:5'-AMP-activated protein kinase catalytic alpha subunit
MKLDIPELILSIDSNHHDHLTTTYYLLLKKLTESGGKTAADINSEYFDQSLLDPKPRKAPQKRKEPKKESPLFLF